MASRSVRRAIRAVRSTQYSVPSTRHERRLESNHTVTSVATRPASGRPAHPLAFGPWRLTRRLPSGGPLALFRAAAVSDRGPGCYVVKSAVPGDVIAGAMLRRESVVAADVDCPHLVSVVATQAECATPYIVQPYLDGVTLRRLMQWSAEHGAAISLQLALSVCRQVTAALAAMHEAGWLHGQVLPEHVIVSPRGHATLIDLTQSRHLQSAECVPDGSGERWPVYASPEIFLARKQFTPAADVYSLGVMLFEMLSGRPPFFGSPQELAAHHRSDRPPDVRRWRPDASKEVSELVMRTLAKEPLRRPSAEQVVRWLAEMEIEELATNPSLTRRVSV
jgi:serine/threonine protein kinase